MKYENFPEKHSMEYSEKVKFISFVDAKNSLSLSSLTAPQISDRHQCDDFILKELKAHKTSPSSKINDDN